MNENLINWNDSYSVSNAEMDTQHKRIIDIINKLFISFKEGKAESILNDILNEMIEYANFHLNSEEKLLYKYDYPQKEEHEKKHQSFRDKIKDFKKALSTGSKDTHYQIIEYLKNWWANHILIEDMKYANFLSNK